jgi:hypothetical protein
MRIAIVGYGSLIWDIENLAPFVVGDWNIGVGPHLPVEFSRISPKRKRALVLTVDRNLQHLCPTSVIESSRRDLEQAIDDLAARERCSAEMIATVQSDSDDGWLAANEYDAAIWAALPANFEEETGQPFNHQKGVDYLQTLTGGSIAEAWRYIEFAPKVTKTPFRQFLQNHPFWKSLPEF